MSICIRKYRVQNWSHITNLDFHYYLFLLNELGYFTYQLLFLPQSWFSEKWAPCSFLWFRVIFHFHDYGRKGPCWTYSITNSSFFPETSTQRNYRGGSIHRRCACVMQQHILRRFACQYEEYLMFFSTALIDKSVSLFGWYLIDLINLGSTAKWNQDTGIWTISC